MYILDEIEMNKYEEQVKVINDTLRKYIKCYNIPYRHTLLLTDKHLTPEEVKQRIEDVLNKKIGDIINSQLYIDITIKYIVIYDIICNVLKVQNKILLPTSKEFLEILKESLNKTCKIEDNTGDVFKVRNIEYIDFEGYIDITLTSTHYKLEVFSIKPKHIIPTNIFEESIENYTEQILLSYKDMTLKEFYNIYNNKSPQESVQISLEHTSISPEYIQIREKLIKHITDLYIHKLCILINVFLKEGYLAMRKML